MAKKIRKKGRIEVPKWSIAWRLLAMAGIIIAIVVIAGILGGFKEPSEIGSGVLLEIALYGTVILIAPLIISLTKKLKRKDKGEGDDSPYY